MALANPEPGIERRYRAALEVLHADSLSESEKYALFVAVFAPDDERLLSLDEAGRAPAETGTRP